MYPPIEPFATGMLPVGDGNRIYWEASGTPNGIPLLHVHGGPGSGIMTGHRRRCDPDRFMVVSFEQRGCGRSRPLVTDPDANLATNTTQASIADMEALRTHLGIDRWLVTGMSWGTTLSLAYAQAHPERVIGLVLFAVTTTTDAEVEWLTETIGRVFPQEWEAFAAASGRQPGQRLIDAYAGRLADPDPAVRARAVRDWVNWEDTHISLDPNRGSMLADDDPARQAVFATLVVHYWANGAFLRDTPILDRMDRLAGIPGVLIHGKLDVSSPLETAWRLHKAWPGSDLVAVDGEGHGGPVMIERMVDAIARLADEATR